MGTLHKWSRMLSLNEDALTRLYNLLVTCAARKQPCPMNREIAERFHLSIPSVVRAFHILEVRRMISVDRFMRGRIVLILANATSTIFNGKRVPHWSANDPLRETKE